MIAWTFGLALVLFAAWPALGTRNRPVVWGGVGLLSAGGCLVLMTIVNSQLPTVPGTEAGHTCPDTTTALGGLAGFLGLASLTLVASSVVLGLYGATKGRGTGPALLLIPGCAIILVITLLEWIGPFLCGMN